MSAQLRPVARLEQENKSVLRVEDIDVGARLVYPYLLIPLQLYIYDQPNSQFAKNIRLAGRMSRDQKFGSGFIKLSYHGIEVPTRDWDAVDRGGEPPTETESIPFNDDTTKKLVQICGKAHQEEAKRQIRALTQTLRAMWCTDNSVIEVCEMAKAELMQDSQMPAHIILAFEKWASLMLLNTSCPNDYNIRI